MNYENIPMTKTYKFEFKKLVRDQIPNLMEKKNIKVNSRNLEGEEYLLALKEKLVEESKEVLVSNSKKDLCEELGDIMEVIYSLYDAIGLSYEEVDGARIKKNVSKGIFEKKIFIDSVEIEEGSPHLDYYLKRADKYPEVQ